MGAGYRGGPPISRGDDALIHRCRRSGRETRCAAVACAQSPPCSTPLYHAVALEEAAILVTANEAYFNKARHLGALRCSQISRPDAEMAAGFVLIVVQG